MIQLKLLLYLAEAKYKMNNSYKHVILASFKLFDFFYKV